ncbi:MAG TPA: BTAD domain-containing putative transcriptional regulator [Candidatus Didemnitutus sp.]|nr:BTAD domain-containing putative transcriptional regulator [Candidatus Didemnitutus sp.]
MARQPKSDPTFDISFYEAVHQRVPDYIDVIELLGGLYTKTGRISDGLRMDRKLVRLQPENATAHYNLACSLALSKRRADALRSLRKAVSLGYHDLDWMSQDPDLQSLKAAPEFQKLLKQLKPES